MSAMTPQDDRVRRRWLPILIGWALLTAVLIGAAYALAPAQYRAVSLIRVDPVVHDLYQVRGQEESLDSFLQTQVQLISSPNILTAAGASPKAAILPRVSAAPDVVAELRKVVKVAIIPKTYLIEVSAETPSASEAATLVNAVVDAYMEANLEWADGMTRSQIKNLESYLDDLRSQSEELERRWKALVSQGDTDLKSKQANLLSPAHGLKIEEKLIENEIRLLELQAKVEAIKASPAPDPKKLDDLNTEILAIQKLDEALKARRASAGFDPRRVQTDEVDIKLLVDQREALKSMEEAVVRRLEQLKFEAKGEARVRPVNMAVPPGKPMHRGPLPWVLIAIPFATFGLFAGLAWATGPATTKAPSPKNPLD